MTSADPKLNTGCNEKCLLNTICNLVKTVYDDNKRCRELQAKLKESVSNANNRKKHNLAIKLYF